MTIKVFWQDPYVTELTTTIKTVQGNRISLLETIFYAFLGGQESDRGTIGGYPVLSAQKEGRDIFYTLPDDHTLMKNDVVQVFIDWGRRYRLMRLHFAAEIVLELVYKKIPDILKVGAHIGENKARIDFRCSQSVSPFLKELESGAQSIIDANHTIMSGFSDEAMERRYWKIEGFASIPCGGTHIKSTGEVGVLTLKRTNPGKGLERIEIFVTDRS